MVAGTETVVPAHGDLRFATGMSAVETVNVRGLEQHLRRHVVQTMKACSRYRAPVNDAVIIDVWKYRDALTGAQPPEQLLGERRPSPRLPRRKLRPRCR